MEVGLTVDRDVWVRRTDANVEIYTPVETGPIQVRMDRRSSSLSLVGVMSTDRGEYEFLSKRFRITRGSATFIGSGELNPTLQATGEYEVQLPGREAVNIRVVIGGTLENPRITLESDAQPPIPQSDLLSYLVFDRATSSLLSVEGSGLSGPTGGSATLVGDAAALAARRLASIALGVAADELEGEATRTLELDVFNITPADVPTEINSTGIGSFLRGTRVEFGKYTDPDTFVGLAVHPATIGPGLLAQRRFNNGFRLELSTEPRFVPRDPSLTPRDPITARNWAAFLIKEWRY
jgi:translocation and assembly module TamB